MKEQIESEKKTKDNYKQFFFPVAATRNKVFSYEFLTCQLNIIFPRQTQISEKQDFKGQKLYFTHGISFSAKILFHPLLKEIHTS